MHKLTFPMLALLAALGVSGAQAGPQLIAIGSLSGGSVDLSGLNGPLESGAPANTLGGLGSGLAYAGGNTFLALPDRGPNATPWNSKVDDTTSYISRFQTISMQLSAGGGSLPFSLTPVLNKTTLLYSATPLNYGAVTPAQNGAGKYYFSGRSDNFAAGTSTNPANGRLDPEGIRVSNDGRSVFISDEYGPYVYQFDRATGQRTRTFALPGAFAVANQSSQGATEIAGNTSGRVANKGMEGLAITPDGKTLVGIMQSGLIQDGGDGARVARIVTIDIATGATKQYAFDTKIGNKTYGISEIVALNDHEFLIDQRDGKGLGDGSAAAVKQVFKIDLAGAKDITGLSGESNLLPFAVNKTLFLDVKAALNAAGIGNTLIPAKIEGMAFGQDVEINGEWLHTLFFANDNDFLANVGGLDNPNQFYVFAFSD
ncbi:MAG: esterase-like activity of phytase family protein, partial [Betaproteobacteria bacterium]